MFTSCFKVWIDAICINQNDTAERGLQIGKMRELYTDAWSVVIWLGDESEDSEKAIYHLETLSRFSDHGVNDEYKIISLSAEVDELISALKNDPEHLGKLGGIARVTSTFLLGPPVDNPRSDHQLYENRSLWKSVH